MDDRTLFSALGLTLALGALAMGCQSGGVGDPCTPEDEYQPTFSGYSVTEVNFESRSFQCETRLCLVNHFRGRVSCPYGQPDPTDPSKPIGNDESRRCHVPGTSDVEGRINVAVQPQLVSRPAAETVYCSCRCGGEDPNARYCDCPSGYECTELLRDGSLGGKELVGSYCVKQGTQYDPNSSGGLSCDREQGNCGEPDGS